MLKFFLKNLTTSLSKIRFLKILLDGIPPKPKKSPNIKQWIYLPQLLDQKEKKILGFLVTLALISGASLFLKIYFNLTEIAPDYGKTYSEGLLKEPRNINPIFISANDSERDIAQLVFSSLITFNGHGEIIPDLAERYEISSDGKSYDFVLRKNILWHDGKKFTADDVIFTVETIKNPLYKSPLRPNWQGVTAEKLDDLRIRFTLRQPYSPFIENLAVGIIPKHLWTTIDPENASLNKLNLEPVGSGPYKFRSFKQKSDGTITQYELKRNKSYYRSGPFIKYIEFKFYKTEEEIISAFKSGKIDGISYISAKNTALLKNEKANLYTLRIPRIFGIFFNQTSLPALSDKKIRQALGYAIDKKKISEVILLGGAIPIDSPIPPGAPGYGDDSLTHEFSAGKAGELLTASGWLDKDNNGFREKRETKNGKIQNTELKINLTTSDWPDLVKTAEAVKEMWKEIGVNTEISILDINKLENAVIRPRNFEALLFGEAYGRYLDPFAFWHSSQKKDPGLNISFYSNKKVDQLLEETRRTSDRELIAKNYADFQKLVIEEMPAVFLNSQLYFYVVSPKVKGITVQNIALPSDRFNEINNWFIDTKRILK